MIREDRPIIFTISDKNGKGVYRVRTNDPRGSYMNGLTTRNILFNWLVRLTEEFNEQGYAVLFEVD